MPRTTLQTGDEPERLTGNPASEPGVEPGLAERLTSLVTELAGLVDDIDQSDDIEGEQLLEAAELFAATVRDRWPDDSDLNTSHRAMVAQYLADEFDGRHEAVLTTATRRGVVTIGDNDMRLSRVERALMDLARMVGGPAPSMVEAHLYPAGDQ